MTQKKPKALMSLFGSMVAEKRKLLGMSQEALAERVGISQESLSRMEKGLIAPRFERLQLFANALYCTVPDLFQEKNPTTARAEAIEKMILSVPEDSQKEILSIVSSITKLISSQ